jgi:hypothetical protein
MTGDNSQLTSLETDNQPWTSVSIDVRSYNTLSEDSETSEETSVNEFPPKVQNYYCGT